MKLSTAGLQIMNGATTETKTRDYRKRNRILYIIEAAFTLLYVTPFFPASSTAKTVIFTALMLIGFALNNVANPPKTDRFMKSVDKDKRGVFTANNEIASLISGMAFSLLLGYVIDGFKAAGNDRGAFATCGAVLGVITILHAVTIISSKDLPEQSIAQTEEKLTETAEASEETKNALKRGGLRAALEGQKPYESSGNDRAVAYRAVLDRAVLRNLSDKRTGCFPPRTPLRPQAENRIR